MLACVMALMVVVLMGICHPFDSNEEIALARNCPPLIEAEIDSNENTNNLTLIFYAQYLRNILLGQFYYRGKILQPMHSK
jgi:hypothetical protein